MNQFQKGFGDTVKIGFHYLGLEIVGNKLKY